MTERYVRQGAGTIMKKPLLIPATMIIAIGIAVFFLPSMIEDGRANAELVERSSTIGGALVGLGLVFFAVVLLRKSHR